MRLGHLLSKLLVSTNNLCGIFSNQRKCHCQLYLCQTIIDDLHTINYLIERGADHNPDLLMSLAHDYEYHDLKEKIYSQLHCAKKLYKELVQKEKEKNRIKRMMESPRYISSFLKKSIDNR